MDSEHIERLVGASDLPSLLAALAHATGDLGLVPEDLWLDPDRALEPTAGWDDDQLARARALAVSGVRQILSGGEMAAGAIDGRVPELIDWVTGANLDDDYRTMLAEELAVTGDLRVPEPVNGGAWPSGRAVDHPVAVIGAGMSGILAAHRLKQAGIDCVVLDKNDDVGGTWLENTYPGCRVDVFNHVYCYSGEQRPDWPEYHSSQPVLLDYFRDCARRWGIRDRIRFDVRVESLAWDDDARHWLIRLDTPQRDREDHGRRGGVSGGPAQPPAYARHRRHRRLRRRAVPQLGLAPRHRLAEPQGGGDRHGGKRSAVHPSPGRGRRPRDRVPANRAMADSAARLPRAIGGRAPTVVRAGSRLRPLVPVAAVLVHPRGHGRRA